VLGGVRVNCPHEASFIAVPTSVSPALHVSEITFMKAFMSRRGVKEFVNFHIDTVFDMELQNEVI
jgi:hypothetical protein